MMMARVALVGLRCRRRVRTRRPVGVGGLIRTVMRMAEKAEEKRDCTALHCTVCTTLHCTDLH